MIDLLRNPNHRSWLLLVVATLVSYGLRADGLVGRSAGFATLALACFKGRLVVLDFMELRHAPRIWRGIIEGWVLLVSALIFLFYACGVGAL